MMVCLISGFLGSGKTTLLVKLGIRLGQKKKRVAVVVNELGEVGVDGAVIDAYGLRSVELTEGCICCSLSGSLMNTLQTIVREYKPDVIFIEPTGVALPNKINDIVRRSMIFPEKNYGMVIVDAFRAEKIHRECELFFRRQIEGEDMIVINKIELVDAAKLQAVRDLVSSLNPNAHIMEISAKEERGIDEIADTIAREATL
jgi:G3E family GTPase